MSGVPMISVMVPTCNRSAMTRRCLDALAKQTHPNVEIVVVDDASTDDTPAMIDAFRAEHPDLNLLVLRNDENLGANASRNLGVQATSGDFVAFLDSDCIAEPGWLEQLLRGFDDERVGAVTGLVLDPPPRNVYDLTFRGTHRVAKRGPARRLVAGNLCVRRTPLLAATWDEHAERPPRLDDGRPDVTFSGACDEEGLGVALRAAGWTLLARPEAVVLHEHHYDRRSFFRQAYHGGRAAAEFVHRYRLPPRLDMAPFLVAYGTLPVALALVPWLGWWPLAIPALAFAAALAAITYNDLARKGKTPWQTIRSFPVLVAYYHVRLFGYVGKGLSLRLSRRPPARSVA
ncbi:MAG: glycosyltransferase [Planctomycetes bacterium]|nr:glycosyltransferase [Planctomycetota bacterium]